MTPVLLLQYARRFSAALLVSNGKGNGNGNENISNAPPTVDRQRITIIVHECLFIGAQ